MKHYIILGVAVVALAGCAGVTDRLGLGKRGADAAPPTAEARAEASLSSATAAARPPSGARTADALDT